MRLDVLPQRVDDDGPGLRVHAQQARQALVQLVLHGLVVQQQQDGAAHVLVPRPLHLRTHAHQRSPIDSPVSLLSFEFTPDGMSNMSNDSLSAEVNSEYVVEVYFGG